MLMTGDKMPCNIELSDFEKMGHKFYKQITLGGGKILSTIIVGDLS